MKRIKRRRLRQIWLGFLHRWWKILFWILGIVSISSIVFVVHRWLSSSQILTISQAKVVFVWPRTSAQSGILSWISLTWNNVLSTRLWINRTITTLQQQYPVISWRNISRSGFNQPIVTITTKNPWFAYRHNNKNYFVIQEKLYELFDTTGILINIPWTWSLSWLFFEISQKSLESQLTPIVQALPWAEFTYHAWWQRVQADYRWWTIIFHIWNNIFQQLALLQKYLARYQLSPMLIDVWSIADTIFTSPLAWNI